MICVLKILSPPRWRKARRQYLTMSSTRWGWTGASDNLDNTGEGENSSGVPGDALAGDDSRDGSQTAAKDDPKVRIHFLYRNKAKGCNAFLAKHVWCNFER